MGGPRVRYLVLRDLLVRGGGSSELSGRPVAVTIQNSGPRRDGLTDGSTAWTTTPAARDEYRSAAPAPGPVMMVTRRVRMLKMASARRPRYTA